MLGWRRTGCSVCELHRSDERLCSRLGGEIVSLDLNSRLLRLRLPGLMLLGRWCLSLLTLGLSLSLLLSFQHPDLGLYQLLLLLRGYPGATLA